MKRLDLIGQTFGRLVVRQFSGLDRRMNSLWKCECVCGEFITVPGYRLKKKRTKSCGCLVQESIGLRSKTHGQTETAEYAAWANMVQRCINPKDCNYPRYGALGVRVCKRWLTFENFFADMGERPTPKHSLSRLGDTGDYRLGNVIWGDKHHQMQQRRIKFEKTSEIPENFKIKEKDLKRRKNNTSGVSGINKNINGKWVLRIQINHKRFSVGSFDTLEEAVTAKKVNLKGATNVRDGRTLDKLDRTQNSPYTFFTPR